jgi:hypothetical protein
VLGSDEIRSWPHIAQRMVPHIQNPFSRDDTVANEHRKIVEDSERSVDESTVFSIARDFIGCSYCKYGPSSTMEVFRHQNGI